MKRHKRRISTNRTFILTLCKNIMTNGQNMDDIFMKKLMTSVILKFTKPVAGICLPSILELLSFVISKTNKSCEALKCKQMHAMG